MKNMRTANQAIIKRAKKKGITIEEFVTVYGIRFTVKLLKHLIKPRKNGLQTTYLICPQNKLFSELTTEEQWQYLEDLENTGFKIKIKFEDFIDEESGEIVPVPQYRIHFM